MLAPIEKEKLEDLKWLDELYVMLQDKTIKLNWADTEANARETIPLIEKEIEVVKHKLETHDYAPLEARRQASIRRLGTQSVYW